MNKFKITIDENNFDVTVSVTDHNKATVEVTGFHMMYFTRAKTQRQHPLLVRLQPSLPPRWYIIHPPTLHLTKLQSKPRFPVRFLPLT